MTLLTKRKPFLTIKSVKTIVVVKVSEIPRHGQPPGSAASAGSSTLADEHVHLLWQVTARAEELLTAAAHGRWPGLELAALAGYA
jgi:hypothetical protein